MPEYGSADSPPVVSPLLWRVQASGVSDAFGAAGPVPDGETWVLTGFDYVGQASGVSTVVGQVGVGGGYSWGDQTALSATINIAGGSWRGEVTLLAASCQFTIWGYKIPGDLF
jgi:hypothetical protein